MKKSEPTPNLIEAYGRRVIESVTAPGRARVYMSAEQARRAGIKLAAEHPTLPPLEVIRPRHTVGSYFIAEVEA